MNKYINILREDEVNKVKELKTYFKKEYSLELSHDDIIITFSTSDKDKNNGMIENEMYSFGGDVHFLSAIYSILMNDYGILDKGKLDSLKQNYCSRRYQSKFILESGLVEYILIGNTTNMNIVRQSPKILHSTFENLIYVIHKKYGENGVIEFIRRANYLN